MRTVTVLFISFVLVAFAFPSGLPIFPLLNAQELEGDVEGTLEEKLHVDLEDDIEESGEEDIEELAEESIETSAEETLEQDAEETMEEGLEQAAEESAEDAAEESIEETAEGDVEESVEEGMEDSAEEDIEDVAEEDIEDAAEEDIEGAAEEDIEEVAEEDIEEATEEDIEETAEADVEDATEEEVEDDIAENVEKEVEDDLDDRMDIGPVFDGKQDERESDEAQGEINSIEQKNIVREESVTERIINRFEIAKDKDDNDIVANEIIFLLSPEDVAKLHGRNYTVLEQKPLDGLDQVVVRVETPEDFDPKLEIRALSAEGVPAKLDHNHLYRPNNVRRINSLPGYMPGQFLSREEGSKRKTYTVGMIDTHIDKNHDLLRRKNIIFHDFVEDVGKKGFFDKSNSHRPHRHGTAVASILVGAAEGYRGLLPEATLYAASVFGNRTQGGELATTMSLIMAIDWMATNGVSVVNMSLSGPPNTVLEAALRKSAEKGVIIVAAAGNQGPASKPLYPAAYDFVLAITAVTKDNRIYRMANRGHHIAFSAPGVNILGAESNAGISSHTGTSMAAPFATAIIAYKCQHENRCENVEQVTALLERTVVDLGKKGRDPVYGHGLIRP